MAMAVVFALVGTGFAMLGDMYLAPYLHSLPMPDFALVYPSKYVQTFVVCCVVYVLATRTKKA